MLNIKTYKPELFSDLIERIWIAENLEKDEELVVPPNQYVSLIFPLNNSRYKRNQIWINTPYVEGVSLKNVLLTYPEGTKLIGIRFFAYGIYPFIQLPGKSIINNSIPYFADKKRVKEHAYFPVDCLNADIINHVYEILRGLFCEKFYDAISQIMNFYNQFRWNDETCSIEEYCEKSGTNYTSLNRTFTKVIGITPKKFERLIKFRKSLCSLIDSKENLTSIGLTSGYFDQAHFIREFKMFLNQTPSDYKTLIKEADKQSKIINYNFKLF